MRSQRSRFLNFLRTVPRARAAVATGHPLTSEAALDLLRAGGNAFDAALAGGFAASLTEPMFTSLGGGGFLLVRTREGRETLFDFFVDAPGRGLGPERLDPHLVPVNVRFPASDQVFHIGPGSVAVPGVLAGFVHVHERLGRLPLERVVAPAVCLARDGVVLNEHQARVMEMLRPINTHSAEGRALFTPGGRALRAGERFCNPPLAEFLEGLAGDGGFYTGALARRMARDLRAAGGLLGEEDLVAYRVVERQPLAVEYRGHRLLTNPAPSQGGPLIALSLSLLAEREPASAGPGSPRRLCDLAELMQEVERRRRAGASGGTTHLSVADAEGNAASLTLSNGEGSGYLLPGTGIMLNNMLGEDDLLPRGFQAELVGRRVASMMSPSILLRDGEPRLIVGSGGSKRIRSALLQVIAGVVDFGLDVGEAVGAPRLHWDGETLQVEPGFPEASVEALRRRWPVNLWPARDLYFGGAHAVDPAGRAAGDPRRAGHARVL